MSFCVNYINRPRQRRAKMETVLNVIAIVVVLALVSLPLGGFAEDSTQKVATDDEPPEDPP
jgi:ABC-type Fe3+ transport system permease subunit